MWIWFVLVSGVFNILLSLIVRTDNLASFLFFKAIPFFSGLGAIIFFLVERNLI